MYVVIEKITPDRSTTEFVNAYDWNTDEQTRARFEDAKRAHAVAFEKSVYLVDLFNAEDESIDTFPLSEQGYNALISKRR